MKSAIVLVRGHPEFGHQHSWGGAFAAGLRRHGWKVEVTGQFKPADLAVFWGVRRETEMVDQRRHGGDICILERGYVGDRFKWTSVSFGGGLNGYGTFRGPHRDRARWELLFPGHLRPWRDRQDGYALICGQVAGDASLRGVDIDMFYRSAIGSLRAAGFEPRLRPHPLSRDGRRPARALADDLAGARFVVTWNSNSAVDAVLAGVPVVTMDRGAMAWPVAGHEFALPPTPDREAWAHRLAWCQWSHEEMVSGACWAAVGRETADLNRAEGVQASCAEGAQSTSAEGALA